uniref:Merozoite surface protein 7 n=1 Tax=Strongyloides stercoralis TaxID=6248 RepID=A0A0K0E4E2_STRER
MYFYLTLFICLLLTDFTCIIKCQIHTNNSTYQFQKPYILKNILNSNQNKVIVKRRFSEEDFKKMNNQYALEQKNQQSLKGIADAIQNTIEPVYGGDRPSNCEQKNLYFCPSRKSYYDDWKCIKLEDLCDSHPDCPNYEDENPTICMFHILLKNQFQNFVKVVKTILEDKRDKR